MTHNTVTGNDEQPTLTLEIPLEDVHERMVDDLEGGSVPVEDTLAQQPQVVQAVEKGIYNLHTTIRYQQQGQG